MTSGRDPIDDALLAFTPAGGLSAPEPRAAKAPTPARPSTLSSPLSTSPLSTSPLSKSGSGPAPVALGDAANATFIGRYRAVSYLGSGGMADVYRCELTGIGGFGKRVVVKRLKPELVDNEEFVHMFLDEARLVARLSHPNIVQVFEIDVAAGVPFIAMELIRGPTLSRLIRHSRQRGLVNLDLLVRVIADAAAGLASAHSATDENGAPLGLVHRDVSPQNIITSAEGVTKLLDFGVAKAEGKLAHTVNGMLKGKIAYMAPEQVASTAVDGRADVFALSVCLYQALTGRLPFLGDTEVEVLRARLKGEWTPLRQVNPDVPEELEAIVNAGLAQDVALRIPSADAMHEALEQYLQTRPGPTDRRAVAQWIAAVFPDLDALVAGSSMDVASTSLPRSGTPISMRLDPRALGGSTGNTPAHQSLTPQPPPPAPVPEPVALQASPPPPSKRPLVAAALLLLIAAGLYGLWPRDDGAEEAAKVQALLDSAEGHTSQDPAVALELLDRVRQTNQLAVAQGDVSARMNRIERDARVALARDALAVKELKTAERHIDRVLDLDVKNEEGRALRKLLDDALAAEQAALTPRPATPAKAAAASVSPPAPQRPPVAVRPAVDRRVAKKPPPPRPKAEPSPKRAAETVDSSRPAIGLTDDSRPVIGTIDDDSPSIGALEP